MSELSRRGLASIVGLLLFLGFFLTAFSALYFNINNTSIKEAESSRKEEIRLYASMTTSWSVATREFEFSSYDPEDEPYGEIYDGTFINTHAVDGIAEVFAETKVLGAERLNFTNAFSIDLSKYPVDNLTKISAYIRYKLSDARDDWVMSIEGEKFCLKLDEDVWLDQVFNVGIDKLKVNGQRGDLSLAVHDTWGRGFDEKTLFYVDFLGVRGVLDVLNITITNTGSETVHVIAIWVQNETHHKRYEVDIYLEPGRTVSSYSDAALYQIARQITEDFDMQSDFELSETCPSENGGGEDHKGKGHRGHGGHKGKGKKHFAEEEEDRKTPFKTYTFKVITERGNIFSYVAKW